MLLKVEYADDVAEDDAKADARERWDRKCQERGRSTDTDVRVEIEQTEGGYAVVMNDGTADIQ